MDKVKAPAKKPYWATMFDGFNLAKIDAPEDEKIAAFMAQEKANFNPAEKRPRKFHKNNKNRNKNGTGVKRIKPNSGIPKSFMTPTSQHALGARQLPDGTYGVVTMHAHAYIKGKKERAPFLPQPEMVYPEDPMDESPEELKCPKCKQLLTDAVLIPCCGSSFCDECIRIYLLDEDEDQVCPCCKASGLSPASLIPNKFIRLAVTNFLNKTGYRYAIPRFRSRMQGRLEKEAKEQAPTNDVPMVDSCVPQQTSTKDEPMGESPAPHKPPTKDQPIAIVPAPIQTSTPVKDEPMHEYLPELVAPGVNSPDYEVTPPTKPVGVKEEEDKEYVTQVHDFLNRLDEKTEPSAKLLEHSRSRSPAGPSTGRPSKATSHSRPSPYTNDRNDRRIPQKYPFSTYRSRYEGRYDPRVSRSPSRQQSVYRDNSYSNATDPLTMHHQQQHQDPRLVEWQRQYNHWYERVGRYHHAPRVAEVAAGAAPGCWAAPGGSVHVDGGHPGVGMWAEYAAQQPRYHDRRNRRQ